MPKKQENVKNNIRIGTQEAGQKNDGGVKIGTNELEDLTIRPAIDSSLGLTDIGDRPPEDWAANTGPTRTAESSGGSGWDPLRSRREPPSVSDDVPLNAVNRDPAVNLEQCLAMELQDLYQAEAEQERILQRLATAASADELKSAFQDHLSETQQQVQRLAQVLEMMGQVASGAGVLPAGVAGLIQESQEKLEPQSDLLLRDLMMIAEAQKMEHNEIASYGTVRAMAHTLGRDEEAHLLQTTLTEEESADKRLTSIALRLMKQTGTDEGPACDV